MKNTLCLSTLLLCSLSFSTVCMAKDEQLGLAMFNRDIKVIERSYFYCSTSNPTPEQLQECKDRRKDKLIQLNKNWKGKPPAKLPPLDL